MNSNSDFSRQVAETIAAYEAWRDVRQFNMPTKKELSIEI